MARRSEAARELMEASDRRVRKVDVDVTLGTNLTATGVALLPAFGITGLGAMPIVGIQLAPEELRQLDKWVRDHTTNRFGPVREVSPGLVLEIAFDGIGRSTRHFKIRPCGADAARRLC